MPDVIRHPAGGGPGFLPRIKYGVTFLRRNDGRLHCIVIIQSRHQRGVDMAEEGLGVKPAVREKSKLCFPYTEEELLAEITPEKAHADAVAQPAGPEIGD